MSSPYPQENKSSGSGGKVFAGCGVGCLVVLVLLVVGGFLAFNFARNKVTELVDQKLADAPVEIVEPEANPQVLDDATTRYETFRNSLAQEGNNPGPLVLSAEDINALLFNHPDFKQVAGHAKVSIENDQLSSQVSVPLDRLSTGVPLFGEALEGKYLNGDATFSIELENGRPSLFVEGISVNGAPLPPEFIQALSRENLLKDAQSKPELMKFFDRLEEIKIENNQLRVVPKAAD